MTVPLTFERYALFYTPSPGPFADMGAAWLGWDAARGIVVPQPEGVGLDIPKLTKRPRKYGFHATLKAPFYLAEGRTAEELRTAVDAFAQDHPPVVAGPLAVSNSHGFLALRLAQQMPQVSELAAATVRAFEPFRAALTEEDIARRRRSRLSPRQDRQLLEFGYPYIFDDFQFHMTLTGPLRDRPEDPIMRVLEDRLLPLVPDPLILDAITLLGQDRDGMFHQFTRAPLRG